MEGTIIYHKTGRYLALRKNEIWMRTTHSKWSYLGTRAQGGVENQNEAAVQYLGERYQRLHFHNFKVPENIEEGLAV